MRSAWMSIPRILLGGLTAAGLLAGTALAQERPAAPVLVAPSASAAVNLAAPANTTLTFAWQPGTGGRAPTRYTLCMTEEGKACNQPGAWVFPFSGQPPITGTTYAARLPGTFQGKRLRWSVTACAGDTPEACTSSTTRLLTWPLPPRPWASPRTKPSPRRAQPSPSGNLYRARTGTSFVSRSRE
jgi:SusE outer membrane protein